MPTKRQLLETNDRLLAELQRCQSGEQIALLQQENKRLRQRIEQQNGYMQKLAAWATRTKARLTARQ
jgi:hypothetical protein